ncbi:hypothetical protein [Coralloluteibacterium stylophorae]|uniref:Uncharacterized protein n=1 Tax=Coralloluteibacterium stylophorae TaxID=1776034 RepID=A0A8J8AX71_9GAMM|nr:hypothetical protein [Coralloluteibacterium stylophorae]MBS7456941.1 hypothetical protein [Coralloluteibacterium stylophorae]
MRGIEGEAAPAGTGRAGDAQAAHWHAIDAALAWNMRSQDRSPRHRLNRLARQESPTLEVWLGPDSATVGDVLLPVDTLAGMRRGHARRRPQRGHDPVIVLAHRGRLVLIDGTNRVNLHLDAGTDAPMRARVIELREPPRSRLLSPAMSFVAAMAIGAAAFVALLALHALAQGLACLGLGGELLGVGDFAYRCSAGAGLPALAGPVVVVVVAFAAYVGLAGRVPDPGLRVALGTLLVLGLAWVIGGMAIAALGGGGVFAVLAGAVPAGWETPTRIGLGGVALLGGVPLLRAAARRAPTWMPHLAIWLGASLVLLATGVTAPGPWPAAFAHALLWGPLALAGLLLPAGRRALLTAPRFALARSTGVAWIVAGSVATGAFAHLLGGLLAPA